MDEKDATEVKSGELTPREAKIFVSIINYRDVEGQYTLRDLFEKAKHPERVYAGYCFQYDPTEDDDCLIHYSPLIESKYGKNIRSLFLSHNHARGPIYARHLVQQHLYRGEHFYLQIDSHMRFIQDWDSILIKIWDDCRDPNAIVTTYPNGYDEVYKHKFREFVQNDLLKQTVTEEDLNAYRMNVKEWDGEINMRQLERSPAILCARQFGDDGFLRISAKPLTKKLNKPIPSLFWAAGFAFSSGRVVSDVAYDGKLKCLFFGEESVMAARLYTNGYNFYCPPVNVVYHLWDRNNSPFRKGLWREVFAANDSRPLGELGRSMSSQNLQSIESSSVSRAKQLLGGESMLYGLGIERTLDEYQEFCGVNFTTREISDRAEHGGLEGAERKLLEETRKEQQFNAVMSILGAIQESTHHDEA